MRKSSAVRMTIGFGNETLQVVVKQRVTKTKEDHVVRHLISDLAHYLVVECPAHLNDQAIRSLVLNYLRGWLTA